MLNFLGYKEGEIANTAYKKLSEGICRFLTLMLTKI